jgi:alpha-tubulin suppressor-like RCC1 family protein
MLLDLPLEILTAVCLQLVLHDLVRIAETCKRFRYGDGGLETVELPTTSPFVTALREHACMGGDLIPSARPIGCSESWVAYMARRVWQRRCREAPPVAAGDRHITLLDAAGRLLSCGNCAAVGHDNESAVFSILTPVAGMAAVRVRIVTAGASRSLALGWDDSRVFSWGRNENGQLGLGDKLDRLLPALVEGPKGVRGVSAADDHSYAVTQSGAVLSWGLARTRPAIYLH